MNVQDLDADDRAFAQLREVLDGRRRLPLDGTSSKMLRILLGGESTDTIVTPDRFVVHFGGRTQRRPCQYYRRLAPPVVSELLERASLEAVREPVVIGLPGDDVPGVSGFPRWSYEPKLVWVVPADDAVRLLVRTSHEPGREPFVRSIPEEGPLAARELPDWSPTAPVFRELDVALTCPRCGVGSTCYRQLRDALVCLTCGRSFVGFEG